MSSGLENAELKRTKQNKRKTDQNIQQRQPLSSLDLSHSSSLSSFPLGPHCRANSLPWLFFFFFLLHLSLSHSLSLSFQHLLTHFRKTLEAEKIKFISFTGNNLQSSAEYMCWDTFSEDGIRICTQPEQQTCFRCSHTQILSFLNINQLMQPNCSLFDTSCRFPDCKPNKANAGEWKHSF